MSNPYHDEKGHFCSKDKASGAFFRECSVSISDYEEAQRSEAFNTQLRAELRNEFGVVLENGDSSISMEQYEQKVRRDTEKEKWKREIQIENKCDKLERKYTKEHEKECKAKIEKIQKMPTDKYIRLHKQEVEDLKQARLAAVEEAEPLVWAREQAMSKLEFADEDERMAIMIEYRKNYEETKRRLIKESGCDDESVVQSLKKAECADLQDSFFNASRIAEEKTSKYCNQEWDKMEEEIKNKATEKINTESKRRMDARNSRTIDYEAREKLLKSTCTDDEYHNIDGLGSFKKIGEDTYIQKGLRGGIFLVKNQERREISDAPLNFRYKNVNGIDCYVGHNYAMEMVCSDETQSVFFRNNCKTEFTNGQARIFVSLMDNSEWGKQLSQLAAENGCSFPNNPWIGRVEKPSKKNAENPIDENQWIGEHYLVTAIDSKGKECFLEYDKTQGGSRIVYNKSPFSFRHITNSGKVIEKTMTIGQYLNGGRVNGRKRYPLQSYQDREIDTKHFDMPL